MAKISMDKPDNLEKDETKYWSEADKSMSCQTYHLFDGCKDDYDDSALGDLIQAALQTEHFYNLVIHTWIANNRHGSFRISAIKGLTDFSSTETRTHRGEIEKLTSFVKGFLVKGFLAARKNPPQRR